MTNTHNKLHTCIKILTYIPLQIMKINASRTDEEISRLSYFMSKETKMPIEIVKILVLLKAEIVLFSKNII